MNKYHILLVTLLIAITYSQKTLNVSCYTCGSTCASGYCFNLTGNGINQLLCPPTGYTCPGNSTVQITVKKCSVDYQNFVCSVGMCYSLANRQIAWFSVEACSGTRNLTCGPCTEVGCGGVCKIIKRNNVQASPNECASSCQKIINVNQTIRPCTNQADTLGTKNSCCYVFDGSGGSVCTSQSTILTSSRQLSGWVSKFQFRSGLSLLILVLLIGFMII